MSEIIITEKQLQKIQEVVTKEQNLRLAKENWSKFSEKEKELVINLVETLYPKKSKNLQEAWYNTVMDVLGIFDPTPVVDIINSISYFSQGEVLFGMLTLIGAIPYAGDFVAKPVIGALKIGGPSVKALESAIKMSKGAAVGSKEYKAAQETIEKLAKEPGVIGTFLQKLGGGLGNKIIKTLDELPVGPFRGMKDTIKSYFQLLSNAGKKGAMFQKRAGVLAKNFQKGTASVDDVVRLKNYLQTQKIFNPATLTKPGFMTNVFFGGIPRLFRSPDGRRLKILMQSTKWWLGFLDYIGLGNWVGPEEISKKMGEEEFTKKLEEYQKTPEAKEYFEEQFSQEGPLPPPPSPEPSVTKKESGDQFADYLKKLFFGQINPIPGM